MVVCRVRHASEGYDSRSHGPGHDRRPRASFCRYRHQASRGSDSVSHEPRRQVLEEPVMKVAYDLKTDTLSVIFRDSATVAESDEDKPGRSCQEVCK